MSENQIDIRMDPAGLFREEVFTDGRAGTIQRLTPVDGNGQDDPSRPVRYIGQAQLMTPAGALPLNFDIEAASLGDAASRFGELAEAAVHEAIAQLQEMRREAASSIVVPGQGGMPNPFGGGGRGGPAGPGGGLILR